MIEVDGQGIIKSSKRENNRNIAIILGTEYEILRTNFNDDKAFKEREIDGYCDGYLKRIVICDISTYPGFEEEPTQKHKAVEQATLRHELIHAFLNESGLMESTGTPSDGWSQNEEMVDWLAIQSPKIFKVFQELDILN